MSRRDTGEKWATGLVDALSDNRSDPVVEKHLDDLLRWLTKSQGTAQRRISAEFKKRKMKPVQARQLVYSFLDEYLFSSQRDNPYRVLGVRPETELRKIRERYLRLVSIYHPDRGESDLEWLSSRTEKLNRAYQSLKNRDTPSAFAARESPRNEEHGVPHDWVNPETPAPGTSDAAYRDISDLFRRHLGSATQFRYRILASLVVISLTVIGYFYYIQSKELKYPVAGISLSAQETVGGSRIYGAVLLEYPAPPGGIAVKLITRGPVASLETGRLLITEGELKKKFVVETLPVTEKSLVNLQVDYAGAIREALLTVWPRPVLKDLEVASADIVATNTVSGIVRLDRPAPVRDIAVVLTSNDSAAQPVSRKVTFDKGKREKSFKIKTNAVRNPTSVTIVASYGAISKRTSVKVKPKPKLTGSRITTPGAVVGGDVEGTVSVSSSAVKTIPELTGLRITTPGAVAGEDVEGTVSVSAPVSSEELRIAITSDSNVISTSDNYVVLGEGEQKKTFVINTSRNISELTAATVMATMDGKSKYASLTIAPRPRIVTVGLTESDVKEGDTIEGEIVLDRPAPVENLIVAISLLDGSRQVKKRPMVFRQGQKRHLFSIAVPAVRQNKEFVVRANYGGQTSSTSIRVWRNARVKKIALDSDKAMAGETIRGIVALDNPAPPGKTRVDLETAGGPITVSEASIEFEQGEKIRRFTLLVNQVDEHRKAVIRAKHKESFKETTIDIFPRLKVTGFVFKKRETYAGDVLQGWILLNAPAIREIAIKVSGGNDAAMPLTEEVIFNSGENRNVVKIKIGEVSEPVEAIVKASYDGSSRSAKVKIWPAPKIVKIKLDKVSVIGGETLNGTVILDGPAEVDGAAVQLTSNSYLARISAATLTFKKGQQSKEFKVDTEGVTKATTVSINASLVGSRKQVRLILGSRREINEIISRFKSAFINGNVGLLARFLSNTVTKDKVKKTRQQVLTEYFKMFQGSVRRLYKFKPNNIETSADGKILIKGYRSYTIIYSDGRVRKGVGNILLGMRKDYGQLLIVQLDTVREKVKNDNISRTITSLLDHYSNKYSMGDIDAFMDLFTETPVDNNNRGRTKLRQVYSDLFRQTQSRSVTFDIRQVTTHDGLNYRVDGIYAVRIGYKNGGEYKKTGPIRITVEDTAQGFKIAGLQY